MTFRSKLLTCWSAMHLSLPLSASPSLLLLSLSVMVLENDYLNAIYNLFTMQRWEGSRVKTYGAGWSRGQSQRLGDTSEGRGRWGSCSLDAVIKKKKRRRQMKWNGGTSLQMAEFSPAFSSPLRTQITQHRTSIVSSQWPPESLGCCSLPFICPLGSNLLHKPPHLLSQRLL